MQQAGAAVGVPRPPQSWHGSQSEPGTPEDDLQAGIKLTRSGHFTEAMPLLRAARAGGVGGYGVSFNLALCEVATGAYPDAITELSRLREGGQETAAVENLLAQAYLGEHNLAEAWTAIQAAVGLSPKDEHMYAFLLDACTDHYEYALGLRVATLGTEALPASQRLHYERAVFLARLDRLEEAEPEFARASALGRETYLGYLARVQQALYNNDLPGALQAARAAVASGQRGHEMLSLLGTVLMYAGAAPGQPEFREAKQALEAALAQQPDDSTAQIALGKLFLDEGAWQESIAHLEIGRRLEPQNPAVYPSLAAAYRHVGDKADAEACVQTLSRLLGEKNSVTAEHNEKPDQ